MRIKSNVSDGVERADLTGPRFCTSLLKTSVGGRKILRRSLLSLPGVNMTTACRRFVLTSY